MDIVPFIPILIKRKDKNRTIFHFYIYNDLFYNDIKE